MALTTADLRHQLATPGTVWLDTTRPDEENGRQFVFGNPLEVILAPTLGAVPEALRRLDAALDAGRWCAGYVAYEAGYAFERIGPAAPSPWPLAWLGVYEAPQPLEPEAVRRLLEQEMNASSAARDVAPDIGRTAYHRVFNAVKAHIREGNVYQINFTDRFTFGLEGDPLALYAALRQRQRVAYGAFLHLDAGHLLSFSPELFFRRHGDRIVTRPMKGTIRRGATPDQDDALRHRLATDPKSRAENLMIVDLLRNDLSVCCRPGTVRVPHLFSTEPYETLIQMTSTIEGRLREDVRYADLFRALFPCGSVTGAPKIRAMQIIRDLEARPRGPYCGAIGYAAPHGEAVFSVAIRTLQVQEGRGAMGTGSGLVWDSEADAEYDECLLKAVFLTHPPPDFELIETMRSENGRLPLLDLHADRLRTSAERLGFAFDQAGFRTRVREAAARAGTDPHKVRTTLDRAGHLTMTVTPLPASPVRFRRVLVAHQRISSTDPLLYHKTTRRQVYEQAYRRARDAGYDEVLFLNERGEAAEGSRTNLFVRQGAALLTPPERTGLLPGVYRRHLLETRSDAAERLLYPADLTTADAVYLCNAVAGLVRVEALSFSEE